jgi:hypothetical protein
MTASDLDRFRQIVLADAKLQDELRGCLDRARFAALVTERAREHGCVVDAAEVSAAFDEAARNWVTRGVER